MRYRPSTLRMHCCRVGAPAPHPRPSRARALLTALRRQSGSDGSCAASSLRTACRRPHRLADSCSCEDDACLQQVQRCVRAAPSRWRPGQRNAQAPVLAAWLPAQRWRPPPVCPCRPQSEGQWLSEDGDTLQEFIGGALTRYLKAPVRL